MKAKKKDEKKQGKPKVVVNDSKLKGHPKLK